MDNSRFMQVLMVIFSRRIRLVATTAAILMSAASVPAAPDIRFDQLSKSAVPAPDELAAEVAVDGRTSHLKSLEIAATGREIPRTFSRDFLGNTEGFEWYASRHFALKTDMDRSQAAETLALLEMALPHLEAIFGHSIAALADRRMALVFASDREALLRAMAGDGMHIVRLGGITQEGFWCAYQYAGSPYQSRYIILHELVHLYQYCLSGNTRQFYGFFIEGIADFFSSHVYDPAAGRLTINVLDRAPAHNHLDSGIKDWQAMGRPALSTLYHSGHQTRGIDVLMTAFLQSSSVREQSWRIYCRETIRLGRSFQDPKILSDRLMASLYGDWQALDLAFELWMQRHPSFVQQAYSFDQEGGVLVSQRPINGVPALMSLHAPLMFPVKADLFTRDYPNAGRPLPYPRDASAGTNAIVAGFSLPPAITSEIGTIGLRLGGENPHTAIAVSNGSHVVITSPTLASPSILPLPAGARKDVLHVRLSFTPAAMRVDLLQESSAPLMDAPLIPLSSDLYQDIVSTPIAVFATAGGLRLIPAIWEKAANSTDALAPPNYSTAPPRAVSSRYGTHPGAEGINRAAWILGTNAPPPLLIARNMLLTDALRGDGTVLLPGEELSRETFWRGIADSIQSCGADPQTVNNALAALSGIALELALTTDSQTTRGARGAAMAQVRWPRIGAARGRLTCRVEGQLPYKMTIRRPRQGEMSMTTLDFAAVSPPRPRTMRVEGEIEWLDLTLQIDDEIVIDPGIPRWQVMGPFMLPVGQFTNELFAPEAQEFPPSLVVQAPDGTQMSWRVLEAPPGAPRDTEFLLHFGREFRRQANNAVAYAATRVEAPQEVAGVLALGAADGLQVWLNGVSVFASLERREWAPGNVLVPVALRQGINTIVVKSIHGDGLWFLSGRIDDAAGRPLPGIVYL